MQSIFFLLHTLPPEVLLDDFSLAVDLRHRLGLSLLGRLVWFGLV